MGGRNLKKSLFLKHLHKFYNLLNLSCETLFDFHSKCSQYKNLCIKKNFRFACSCKKYLMYLAHSSPSQKTRRGAMTFFNDQLFKRAVQYLPPPSPLPRHSRSIPAHSLVAAITLSLPLAGIYPASF